MKDIKGSIHRKIHKGLYVQCWNLARKNVESKIWFKPHKFTLEPVRGQINFTLIEQLNLNGTTET